MYLVILFQTGLKHERDLLIDAMMILWSHAQQHCMLLKQAESTAASRFFDEPQCHVVSHQYIYYTVGCATCMTKSMTLP